MATMRPLEPADVIGAMLLCPHCAQVLKIVSVDESGIGFNPERGPDRYFIVRFEDGATARFWHDNKGVVLNDDGTPMQGDPKMN